MSALTDFTGRPGPRNYITLSTSNPVSINYYYGIPQINGATTGINSNTSGSEITAVVSSSANPSTGSDIFNALSTQSIEAGWCDTISANYSCYISGGGTWNITRFENRVKTITGMNFTITNGTVNLTNGLTTQLTDASIGVAIYGGGGLCRLRANIGNSDCPNLANVTLKCRALLAGNQTVQIFFLNCALTAQSVENILVALDNCPYGDLGATSINLSGGTSAGAGSLTAAASAARNSLLAKGVAAITLNP